MLSWIITPPDKNPLSRLIGNIKSFLIVWLKITKKIIKCISVEIFTHHNTNQIQCYSHHILVKTFTIIACTKIYWSQAIKGLRKYELSGKITQLYEAATGYKIDRISGLRPRPVIGYPVCRIYDTQPFGYEINIQLNRVPDIWPDTRNLVGHPVLITKCPSSVSVVSKYLQCA